MVKSADFAGLKDWLIQRVTAVVLAAYTFFLFTYLLFHPHLDFIDWSELFSASSMRYFTLITLIALLWHAWLGVWTIATDYIKCARLRLVFYTLVLMALTIYFFWGLQIIFNWSVSTWGA